MGDGKTLKSYKLSWLESVILEYNKRGQYLPMFTTFLTDEHSISMEKTRSNATKAIRTLQQRHPFLRSRFEINPESQLAYLIEIEDSDPFEHLNLEFIDLTDGETPSRDLLIDQCCKFNTKLFDMEQKIVLLWRAQLISYRQGPILKHIFNLVTFTALSDGLSINAVSVEFVNIFNALSTGLVCREMNEKLEACESMHWYFKNQKLGTPELEEFAREIKKKETCFKLDAKFESPDESGFYLNFLKLEADVTRRILAAAKSASVRLTAFYYTALFYALNKVYLENGLEMSSPLDVEFNMNLRMRFEPQVPLNACRFMAVFGETLLDKSFGKFADFWADCRYLQTVVDKLSSTKTGAIFADMYHYPDIDDYDFEDPGTDCQMFVSNLGTFVSDAMEVALGPLKIDEVYCSDSMTSVPHDGKILQVHIAYWKGESMLQFGANKRYFGSVYCKRLFSLYHQTILEQI